MLKSIDSDVMQRLPQLDKKYFDLIYNDYWDVLLRIALKKTGKKELAMDLVQDLFVDVWAKRHTIQIQSSLQGFLVSALYHKIFIHFRKSGIQDKHVLHYMQFKDREDCVALFDGDYELEYEQMLQKIDFVVDKMPVRMREVFELKYYKLLSNHEIAACLGISLQTVKNQLTKSLSYIRSHTHDYQLTAHVLTIFLCFFLQ